VAVTSTQSKNPASVAQTVVGRYLTDATAAAITITLGFQPRYVAVFNTTSGDKMEWFEGMAAASAFKQVAAGTSSIITSLGITVSAGGFIIGLDTDVNVINEQISYIAVY
jgi:hypothetical protein